MMSPIRQPGSAASVTPVTSANFFEPELCSIASAVTTIRASTPTSTAKPIANRLRYFMARRPGEASVAVRECGGP